MINNSLITSFFNSPHTNRARSHQSPVLSSPVLLTQESIESLETLSILDRSPRGSRAVVVKAQPNTLDDSIILLSGGDPSSENTNRDQSIVLIENSTENCASYETEPGEPQTQVQTTLSEMFKGATDNSNILGAQEETRSRGRRKAAIKASIQMANILTPSRCQPPSQSDLPDERRCKKGVASIFLNTSEKRKQQQEEERRKELEEKKKREIESEKYEAFYKFATEPIISYKSVPDSSSQQGPIPPDETLLCLWTPLQHVRQTSTPSRASSHPLPLLDIPTVPIESILERNYNFLGVTSVIDSFDYISRQIKVDISERDREDRVSELVELFPSLPVRELYSLYHSLTSNDPVKGGASVSSSTDGKKRTRQKDMDTALSFRTKRRRNQSSVSSDDSNAECFVVDSLSKSTPSSQEAVLWTEKYLPHSSSLLLLDSAAVSAMKSFLKSWKEGSTEKDRAAESSSESCNAAPKQALSSDDEDFESFINKHRIFDEDTCDSLSSTDASLAGTMLAIGGVSAGKTAAVYVIAREMGLKVLEINTIMNRSGRDLQLILSEATQSFRVSSKKKKSSARHSANTTSSKQRNSDKRAVDENLRCALLDLKSRDRSRDVEEARSELTLTDDTLILLDEVDIMFESDKGFWPAFQQIARETKLPIFLTANETNDFEILPDIFTNFVSFSSTSLEKMSLFIHIICLVHDLDIPNQLALDMARYYWPDLRQLTLLLQFWLTPRTRKNSGKRKGKRRNEGILNFLASFSFRNTGLLFNIHSLLKTYVPTHVCSEGTDEHSGRSKYKYLHRQFIARDIFSNLEIYRAKFISNCPSSPISSARFGDGFSPDASLDLFSQFDRSLCNDLIDAASGCVTHQVESLTSSDILNKSFYDLISSQELRIDKRKEWERSLFRIADSILLERGDFSVRNFGEHYLPYLKVICVSETYRQMNNPRRHFKHYLTSSLTSVQIDLLSNSDLVH